MIKIHKIWKKPGQRLTSQYHFECKYCKRQWQSGYFEGICKEEILKDERRIHFGHSTNGRTKLMPECRKLPIQLNLFAPKWSQMPGF